MTVGEYISQYPDTKFAVEYYFDTWCEKCHTSALNLDEEYSFDVTASDIGTTGYDWIFDIDIESCPNICEIEISDNIIKIIAEDTTIECDSCKENNNHEY